MMRHDEHGSPNLQRQEAARVVDGLLDGRLDGRNDGYNDGYNDDRNGDRMEEPDGGYLLAGEISRAEKLIVALNRLIVLLERTKLAEFVEIMQREPALFWRSFVAGLCRGMGFALGFGLLSALALYVLDMLAELGIPVLGDFIAELMVYIESVQRSR